jgi:hypothetical protein
MACHAFFTPVFLFAFEASSSRLRDRARVNVPFGLTTFLPRVARPATPINNSYENITVYPQIPSKSQEEEISRERAKPRKY